MLDVLRRHSQSWIIKVLFILLILSFGVWGVGDMVVGNAARAPVVTVGSSEIGIDEVSSEYKREMDRLQPMFGGQLTAEQAKQFGLLDRVLEQVVSRALLDHEGKGLGLAGDDEALRREIAANPVFRNQFGQFDPGVFRAVLNNAGLSEQQFVETERKNMVRERVANAVTGGAAVPGVALDPLYRYRNEKRMAEAVTISAESFPAPQAPDEPTLEKFHKDNVARFMAPEYRTLTALILRIGDVAGDIAITDEQIAETYNARIEEFQAPERRNVQQILVSEAEVGQASDLVAQGKDLPAIAAALGGKDVVDLGWMQKADAPPQLAEAIFALADGKVGAPVQSPLGLHVVKVSGIEKGATRSLADVRDQIRQELINEKGLDRLYELSNKVEDALGGGATLEDAAAKLNLKTVKGAIDAQGIDGQGRPAVTLPLTQRFLQTAFQTEQGRESQLTEMEGGGYFIVRVDEVTPPAPKPFQTVKADVIGLWQLQQRQSAAADLAKQIAERLKTGEDIAAVAAQHKLKVETVGPFSRADRSPPAMPPAAAAELMKGAVGAVATAATPAGTVVARLKSVTAAEPASNPEGIEQLRAQLSQAMASDLFDQYVAALNADVGVKVNRKLLDERF